MNVKDWLVNGALDRSIAVWSGESACSPPIKKYGNARDGYPPWKWPGFRANMME